MCKDNLTRTSQLVKIMLITIILKKTPVANGVFFHKIKNYLNKNNKNNFIINNKSLY